MEKRIVIDMNDVFRVAKRMPLLLHKKPEADGQKRLGFKWDDCQCMAWILKKSHYTCLIEHNCNDILQEIWERLIFTNTIEYAYNGLWIGKDSPDKIRIAKSEERSEENE